MKVRLMTLRISFIMLFSYNIPEIWPVKSEAGIPFRVSLWSRALPETGPCLAPASYKKALLSSSNALDLGASYVGPFV
jgi:hypothetical protein